jgi:hypothetical protein
MSILPRRREHSAATVRFTWLGEGQHARTGDGKEACAVNGGGVGPMLPRMWLGSRMTNYVLTVYKFAS